MKEWIKKLFSASNEATGKRVGSAVILLTFVFWYSYTSMKINTLQDIPANWVIVLCAILGIAVASNIAERKL